MDIFLHIGSGKTGTSSIQHFLGTNRAALASLGYLYPETPGKARHQDLGFFIAPESRLPGYPNWNRSHKGESPAAFRAAFRERFLREVQESGADKVVLCDEALYGLPEASLERLRGLLDELAAHVHVVVYLRRQDDHLISRYQQVVKVGETRTLAQWAGQDMRAVYDYAAELERWARVLRPASMRVRPFERGSFVDGSLFQDVLAVLGIDLPAAELTPVERRNESLDADAVELLRQLNVRSAELDEDEPHLNMRRLVLALAARPAGPTLTLPEEMLDTFMAQWAESNRAVASTWLDRPDGELFREPRKARNTTTTQRLEPAAAGRLLEEIDVPPRLRRRARSLLGLSPTVTPPPPAWRSSRLASALRRARNLTRSGERSA